MYSEADKSSDVISEATLVSSDRATAMLVPSLMSSDNVAVTSSLPVATTLTDTDTIILFTAANGWLVTSRSSLLIMDQPLLLLTIHTTYLL